ncbi:hypothetical protein E4T56_gene5857 [Termitomyces sp. T112]|nr:hypothetical protein E4T56_gene5857 [Termitomyces sp. T112]KAH0590693.1 hypothetical protein H2248_000822 [Termitomyces sp. 'cryptogamus']KNZ71387.1 hypothetical protein J132_09841 [Termitomyces sp. J132]
MITGLSKASTQYLAPLLLLTALLLSSFSFLAPVVMLHNQVALLTVTPSTSLVQGDSVDGPSIFLGLLGSCSQAHKSAPLNCTSPTLTPVYDTSVLPSSAPSLLLSPPTASTPAFIAISLGFLVSFFVTFTLISFHHKMRKFGTVFHKPLIQRISAWVGFIGFIIGLTAFLIVRMWFGKAVQDFNSTISLQGQQVPIPVAATGNAFTMAWVAFAFYAIPVIISLTKFNVTSQ